MLPDVSFAVQSIVVLPSGKVFDALLVIVTGSMSVAVALPIGTVLLSSDVASKVTAAGGVSFGGTVFTTSITWVAFALFPASSVAIHNTVVLPRWKVFDALLVTETTLTLSEDVAFPIDTVLLSRVVATLVIACGAVIF